MRSQKKGSERKPGQLLAIAAVLHVCVGAGAATAQTVMVRSAPAGATIELLVNATPAGSVKADAGGDATLTANLKEITGKDAIDANVYVDVCEDARRIVIVERGQVPAAQPAGCERRDTGALFLVQRISTVVVNVGGMTPSVLLRQGTFRLGPRTIVRAPRGLVLFGGVGMSMARDAVQLACGNVTQCAGENAGVAYTGGATFWLTPFFGAEASYTKPAEATAGASSETLTFDSALDAEFATIAAKVGVPIGRVRLYGQFGTTYHRATFSTSQASGDLSQTLAIRTAGWGWAFGGGLEVWLSRPFGLYAEGGRAALKGSALDGAEGEMDERLTSFVAGARIRLGF